MSTKNKFQHVGFFLHFHDSFVCLLFPSFLLQCFFVFTNKVFKCVTCGLYVGLQVTMPAGNFRSYFSLVITDYKGTYLFVWKIRKQVKKLKVCSYYVNIQTYLIISIPTMKSYLHIEICEEDQRNPAIFENRAKLWKVWKPIFRKSIFKKSG